MKKIYKILALVLLLVFAFGNLTVFAKAETNSTNYIIDRDSNSYTLNTMPTSGILPMIRRGSANALEINQEIEKIQAEIEAEARKSRALMVNFSYEVVVGGLESEFVSIIILSETEGALVLNRVDTIVIHAQTREILGLSDILGPNAVSLVNNLVEEHISNDSRFFSNISPNIGENHNFYVEDNALYIVFNKYEIASGSEGILEIGMLLDNVLNLTLNKDDYHLSGLYGIRMVPLRRVCESFGFKISWSSSSQTATITKQGIPGTIAVTIGSNRYTRSANRNTPFETRLELAPEIIDGSIHVPITFVETMLGLTYGINQNGEITISEYLR